MVQEKTHSVNEHNCSDRESGIFGGLMLSLRVFLDRLEVHRGFKMNSKPRELDCLIIDKKDDAEPMDNDIARIFAKHNIVELKNPFEPLTVDTVWKVISYAAQYKSSGKRVDEIKAEDVTITILRASRPRKALKMLKERGYKVDNTYPGVYYISGMADFRTQIVVSSELEGDEFVPLRIQRLGADNKDIQVFQAIYISEYTGEEKEFAELILKFGIYENIYDIKGESKMKTTYEQLLEMNREKDKREKENSALAFLKEGVSVEIVSRCIKLPKKRVKELASSLKVAAAE